MASLEEQFQKACDAGDLPGVVLVASDAKGTSALLSSHLVLFSSLEVNLAGTLTELRHFLLSTCLWT